MSEEKSETHLLYDDEAIKIIGEKIREIKTLKQISQENLANESDSGYSQVNRMELWKVTFSISSLHGVARALNVNPRRFIGVRA